MCDLRGLPKSDPGLDILVGESTIGEIVIEAVAESGCGSGDETNSDGETGSGGGTAVFSSLVTAEMILSTLTLSALRLDF